MDTKTGTLVGTVDGLNGIHGVAIDDALGRGHISNGRTNTVTLFDTKTLQKIGGDIPVDPGPDCIIFDPATKRVFTFNGESSMSTVIDIAFAGDPEYSVADGQGFIFNNVEDQREVEQIDAESLKIVHVWSIAPGENPSGIAMDRQNRRTFSVCRNESLIVSNADTATVSAVLVSRSTLRISSRSTLFIFSYRTRGMISIKKSPILVVKGFYAANGAIS